MSSKTKTDTRNIQKNPINRQQNYVCTNCMHFSKIESFSALDYMLRGMRRRN